MAEDILPKSITFCPEAINFETADPRQPVQMGMQYECTYPNGPTPWVVVRGARMVEVPAEIVTAMLQIGIIALLQNERDIPVRMAADEKARAERLAMGEKAMAELAEKTAEREKALAELLAKAGSAVVLDATAEVDSSRIR